MLPKKEQPKKKVMSRRDVLRLMGLGAAATALAACKLTPSTAEVPATAVAATTVPPTTVPATTVPATTVPATAAPAATVPATTAPTTVPPTEAAKEIPEWVVALPDDPGVQTNLLMPGGAWGSEKIHPHMFENGWIEEGYKLNEYPRLAEKWEIIDNKTIKLYLRKGVKFHDGGDFTADDVKYTYETNANDPKLSYNSFYTGIKLVEVLDPYTCVLHNDAPYSSMITALSWEPGVLSKAAREAMGVDAFNKRPVGTGPYKVASDYQSGTDLILEAFDGYYFGKPKPDRLVMKYIPDPSTRAAELLAGHVHICPNPNIADIPMLQADPNIIVRVEKGSQWFYHIMNPLHPQLGDVRVRQAINYAIDKEEIVKNVLGGYGTVNNGLIPYGIGHLPDLGPWPYDPDKARSLLREAGLENKVSFNLNSVGLYLRENEIDDAIAQMLKQVGITCNVQRMEHTVGQQNYEAGTFDVYISEWTTQKDPYFNLLYTFVWSPVMPKYKPYDELRALLDQSQQVSTEAERQAVLEDFNRKATELCPVINIYSGDGIHASRKEIPWEPCANNAMWYETWYFDRHSLNTPYPEGTFDETFPA